jgi:hypothetical protein
MNNGTLPGAFSCSPHYHLPSGFILGLTPYLLTYSQNFKMHCCWTVCIIRLVLTVFVCTSVVCAASTPVQGDDALPPSPSTVPNPTSTEETLTGRAKNPNKTGNRKGKGGTKAMTGIAPSGAGSSTLSQLFPVQGSGSKWTTLDGAPGALPLSDATLRPHHAAKGVQHKYGAYDGKSCLKSHYPAGSWNLKGNPKGGISFYAPGPANVNLEKAKEAIFSYSVLFPPGFAFVKGGKLPGFCVYNLCSSCFLRGS